MTNYISYSLLVKNKVFDSFVLTVKCTWHTRRWWNSIRSYSSQRSWLRFVFIVDHEACMFWLKKEKWMVYVKVDHQLKTVYQHLQLAYEPCDQCVAGAIFRQVAHLIFASASCTFNNCKHPRYTEQKVSDVFSTRDLGLRHLNICEDKILNL